MKFLLRDTERNLFHGILFASGFFSGNLLELLDWELCHPDLGFDVHRAPFPTFVEVSKFFFLIRIHAILDYAPQCWEEIVLVFNSINSMS